MRSTLRPHRCRGQTKQDKTTMSNRKSVIEHEGQGGGGGYSFCNHVFLPKFCSTLRGPTQEVGILFISRNFSLKRAVHPGAGYCCR